MDELENRDKKLGELGEEGVLEKIISKYIHKPLPGEYLDYPDDARDILPISPRILVNIDGYSISSMKLPWRTWSDVGYVAVAGAISDQIAKGAVPRDIMVSLGLPPSMEASIVEEIYKGIDEASRDYNLRLLGGDTNSSSTPWISVAVIGYTTAKKPPSRKNAKPGDIVVVTSLYGAMGYVAINGVENAIHKEWVVEATKRPRPFLETAIVIASNYRGVHASIDVSDGLGYALRELSKRSNVRIILEDKPLYYKELEEICNGNTRCLWKYILNGGEEYGVILTIDPRLSDIIIDYMKKFRIPHKIIGRVEQGHGLVFEKEEISIDEIVRWDHFKGWVPIFSNS